MTSREPSSESLRLAILATPRSGNTWLKALLRAGFGLSDTSVFDPADVCWDALPPRTLVQVHALPTPEITRSLAAAGAVPLIIARHPLDVLISILQFAPHHPDTNRWVLGLGGGEDEIRGASPVSAAFAGYAVGPRAAALLSVSVAWWAEPGAVRVRYEDLVADPVAELTRIAAEIRAEPVRPLPDVVAEHSLNRLRVSERTAQHHMWKGQPGLWKRFITPGLARAVAEAHPDAFARFGYECDPDETLTEDKAGENWASTLAETKRHNTDQLWDLIQVMRADAADDKARIAFLERQVAAAAPAERPSPPEGGAIPRRAELTFGGPIPGFGFYDPEPFEGGHYRWTRKTAGLELRIAGAGELWLSFEVRRAVDPSQLDGLTAEVNGHPVALVRLPADGADWFVGRVPEAAVDADWFYVMLRVAGAVRPCDAVPGSTDRRELGVALSRIGFEFTAPALRAA